MKLSKDDLHFNEIARKLGRPKRTVSNHLKELDKKDLVENDQKKSTNSASSGRRKSVNMWWIVVSYALGVATTFLVLKWSYFNFFFKEYPLIFWLIGLFLSVASIIKAYWNKREVS